MTFNRTFTAGVILKHINSKQETKEYLLLDLIYNLVEATFFQFKPDGKIDLVTKSYILFTYTNSCYFIFDWFDKDKEGILNTRLMIEGDKANKGKIESYFGSPITDILDIPKNNFLELNPNSLASLNLPDLTIQFKKDIVNGLINLREKDRIFSKDEMKEFLVYYTFSLLITLVKAHQVRFDFDIIDLVCDQIETACEEIIQKLRYDYSQVNPREEILSNINNTFIPELTEKYLNYAFQNFA